MLRLRERQTNELPRLEVKVKVPATPVASEENVNMKPGKVHPVFGRRYLSAVKRNVVGGTTVTLKSPN